MTKPAASSVMRTLAPLQHTHLNLMPRLFYSNAESQGTHRAGTQLLHTGNCPTVDAGECGKGVPCGGGVSSNHALLFIFCALPTTPWTYMHT